MKMGQYVHDECTSLLLMRSDKQGLGLMIRCRKSAATRS